MTSHRLSALDAAWIITESRPTPNHIGGLLMFRLPKGAPREFFRRLMQDFRQSRSFSAPWNQRLKLPFNKNPFPEWVRDSAIDLEYHVRHAALPWPGGQRELGELIGRLQSTPIDLTRPPWECTIIEGLDQDRFAIFIKMHHSLIDGVSAMKLMQKAMSPARAKSISMPPFWAQDRADDSSAKRRKRPASGLTDALQALRTQLATMPQLIGAVGKIVRSIADPSPAMAIPFDTPMSVLNARVREKRRFATQQFELARLRKLAAATDCTLNDVVLALCAGALRQFLSESGQLPQKSLTAGIPVSIRPHDDAGTGNAISFIVAALGTHLSDAAERLEWIKTSVHHAKAHLQSMPRQALSQYTMLLMAPTMLMMLGGVGGRIRPMFNVTISNVPGPEKPLYFRGAQLLATYPASIVTHGQALNITCQSYAGYMNFGFTGCHATLPSLQRIAVYAEAALVELESAFSLSQKP